MLYVLCLGLIALAAVTVAAVGARRTTRWRRTAVAVLVAPLALLSLAACGSSDSSTAAPPPSASSSSTASSSTGQADCTSEALLSAVPAGATMQKFNCANAGGQEWAAVMVDPGNTVFFLTWNGSTWDAETAADVCGTASAGVPAELMSYCGTPSPSTSPAAATCTSQALLAALPGGATMQKFNCANAGGQEWAAVRVNPGNTVFFLKQTGSTWNAETSGDVCGTASAGLPAQLLAYCKG